MTLSVFIRIYTRPHFIWLVGGQRTQFPSMNVEMTVFYRHIDENAPTGAGLTEGKLMWFKKETTDKLSKGKASIHEAAFNKLFLRVERYFQPRGISCFMLLLQIHRSRICLVSRIKRRRIRVRHEAP